MENLLEVKNLQFSFRTYGGVVKAVRDVSFEVRPGEILGIVGESGCGKSVTSQCLMRLNPEPPGFFEGGEILYKGKDVLKMNKKELRQFRGKEISYIFQDPMTSLNPVATVGDQIAEGIIYHSNGQKVSQEQIDQRVGEVLEMVGIPAARKNEYPHQFSGGMKQRVVIAMALSCQPDLLIADEPTTALDVTIQAQVLSMMSDLRDKLGTAMIMITHDLGIVAQVCDKVAVMYAGQIIESGTLEDIFTSEEHHPYTKGLFGAIPNLKVDARRLSPIEGLMPDPSNLPSGCHFHDRCPHCMDICREQEPAIYSNGTHCIACHLYDGWDGKKEETT